MFLLLILNIGAQYAFVDTPTLNEKTGPKVDVLQRWPACCGGKAASRPTAS
jgi:hypothetical protein